MKMNNLRDTWTVIKFTMRDLIGRKSFRISTLIILVLIVAGFNLPRIISEFSEDGFENTVLIADPENLYDNQLENLNNLELGYNFKFENLSFEEIKTQINDHEISSAIIVSKKDNIINLQYIVDNTATMTSTPTPLIDALSNLYTNLQIQKLHLTSTQLAQISPNFNLEINQVSDQEIGGNITVMMFVSILLFFAIYFCAYQVSSSITVEKTSKIMETLVTSTSPRTIVLGKTIGIGLVGLGQVVLFVATAVFSAYTFLDPELLNSMFDLSTFTPYLAFIMILYFILGYFTYALLYALTGSTISKPEDIQSANMPVAIITMIGFYLAYFTLIDPTSKLNSFAALFPFSSPFCMPIRVMMGIASGWEVIGSIMILLITCALIAHIAIKIYSNAILNYGTKMSLHDIIKTYKEK